MKNKRYWNFYKVSDDEYELNLEGEMLETHPKDWWTGQPIDGNFICSDEFEKEWKNVKDSSKLTVRINSVGGDLFTGMAIRNKLAGYKGELIIINLGIMASAASLLATLPNAIVKAFSGSVFMIHGVMGYFEGYFNAKALKENIKSLEAYDKAIAKMYAEKMNIDEDKIRNRISQETYYVGQEAVDEGLCDEIIETESAKLEAIIFQDDEEDDSEGLVNLNGLQRKSRELIRVINKLDPSKIQRLRNNKPKINERGMIMNEKELLAKYPELINGITQKAVDEERKRIQAIEEIQNGIANKDLVNEAKFGETPMTAQELAFRSMKEAIKEGNAFLNSKVKETNDPTTGTNTVQASASPQDPQDPKTKEAKDVNDAVKAFEQLNKIQNGGRV